MIQYLKDSDRVIKVDTEAQTVCVCLVKNDQMLLRKDTTNSVLYTAIENGTYEPATEQEYLDKKAQILLAI